jgi:hypothetical protein
MSPGAILTRGIGIYSDINHVVTLGYGIATPTPTPTPTPTVDIPRTASRVAPVDFVQLSGGMFVQKMPSKKEPRLHVGEPAELAEMMELYSRWKGMN